jgi:hypothetical protein
MYGWVICARDPIKSIDIIIYDSHSLLHSTLSFAEDGLGESHHPPCKVRHLEHLAALEGLKSLVLA